MARMMGCKFVAIVPIVVDIYDVHGTYEELELFTETIERWEIFTAARLPRYMRVCYGALLNTYAEFEVKLSEKGNFYRMQYAKEALKVQVRAYFQEAKWFKKKYIPRMEEYMEVESNTSFYCFSTTSFLGLGAIVTIGSMNWVFSDPKIVKGAYVIGRLLNDIVGHKFEQKRGHIPSSVKCFINQYGVTEENAKIELMKQAIDTKTDPEFKNRVC
ncbi:(-)-germacrene D synthase-like [Argentina anserina]|uniref:(-)-germacrene D synthase-like n=1 Tax=Argentina anserina TaxID=57926 RepID=UPI00217650F2|nr:(-)-germacrene D synthase-like [Potentilla anserina]